MIDSPLLKRLGSLSEEVVVVTGAAGFLGKRVADRLLATAAARVRLFVRSTAPGDAFEKLSLDPSGRFEIVRGALLSKSDCNAATRGATVILHLAAGIDKSFAGAFMNSVLTTRNLIDSFLEQPGRRRFVSVSSFAVYSTIDLPNGSLVDETCPLEDRHHEKGDAYGFGKRKQDALVEDYGRRRGLPYVIVRPGSIFGPGKPALSGRVGIDTFGRFIQIGGRNTLPLTYVDNCADAILCAAAAPGLEGEVLNVVDDDLPSAARFFRAYRERTGVARAIRVPYSLAYALCYFWETYSRLSNGQLPPAFNRRRCSSEWKRHRYSNRKLKERTGWKPRVPMAEAINRFLGQFDSRRLR
jgi:nucleoside-diphosphate-sugar epimerase